MNASFVKPPIPIYLHRTYLMTASVAICFNSLAFYMICSRSVRKQDTVFAVFTQTIMTALSVWTGFFYQVYVTNDVYVNTTLERYIPHSVYLALFDSVGVCLAAQLFIRQQAIAPFGSILKVPPLVAYVLIGIHFVFYSVGTVIIYLIWQFNYKDEYPALMNNYIAFITFGGAIYFIVFYIAMRMHVSVLAKDKTNISLMKTHKKAMLALNAQVINLLICFGLPMFLDKIRIICLVKWTPWYNFLFYLGYIVPCNICIPNCIVMILLTKRYRDLLKEWTQAVVRASAGFSNASVSSTSSNSLFKKPPASSSNHK